MYAVPQYIFLENEPAHLYVYPKTYSYTPCDTFQKYVLLISSRCETPASNYYQYLALTSY